MKITATLLFVVALALPLASCKGRRAGTGSTPAATTQTIAPAAAKPDLTGTDATTQTVEVDDSRSEAEGGVRTDSNASARKKTTTAPAKKVTKKPGGRG